MKLNSQVKKIISFSSSFACSKCGYSISELEPNVSFNNPFGACEKCDGLGVIQYFDKNKIVQDEDLSINSGAKKTGTEEIDFFISLDVFQITKL